MTSLQSRILVAVIGFPTVVYLIIQNSLILLSLLVVATFLAVKEYIKMRPESISWLIWGWGIFYIILGMFSFYSLRQIDENGSAFALLLFVGVSINDTFSYFIGKAFGKNKLAKNISPNKTYEGLLGGLLGSIILVDFFDVMIFDIMLNEKIFLIFVLNIIGLFGDLLESYLKRKANVKDSSSLLLGHGGMLDRIDSLLLTSLVTFFYVLIR
jgi:phosphatidate cytidylyltransferase